MSETILEEDIMQSFVIKLSKRLIEVTQLKKVIIEEAINGNTKASLFQKKLIEYYLKYVEKNPYTTPIPRFTETHIILADFDIELKDMPKFKEALQGTEAIHLLIQDIVRAIMYQERVTDFANNIALSVLRTDNLDEQSKEIYSIFQDGNEEAIHKIPDILFEPWSKLK